MIWYSYTLGKDFLHRVNEHNRHFTYLSFFSWLEHLGSVYSVIKFQLYNTVLSTIVIMLYIISLSLIHLLTETLYPFTNLSLVP